MMNNTQTPANPLGYEKLENCLQAMPYPVS